MRDPQSNAHLHVHLSGLLLNLSTGTPSTVFDDKQWLWEEVQDSPWVGTREPQGACKGSSAMVCCWTFVCVDSGTPSTVPGKRTAWNQAQIPTWGMPSQELGSPRGSAQDVLQASGQTQQTSGFKGFLLGLKHRLSHFRQKENQARSSFLGESICTPSWNLAIRSVAMCHDAHEVF